MYANVIFAVVVGAVLYGIARWHEGPRTCDLCHGAGIWTNGMGDIIKCPRCKNGSL